MSYKRRAYGRVIRNLTFKRICLCCTNYGIVLFDTYCFVKYLYRYAYVYNVGLYFIIGDDNNIS